MTVVVTAAAVAAVTAAVVMATVAAAVAVAVTAPRRWSRMADDVLETLLRVQEHDTVGDQLRHRRASMPERDALRSAESSVADVDRRLQPVLARAEELDRAQKRLEDEVASIESKIAETNRKLSSGTGAPRELQAMQESIESMRRRQSSLEDHLLEIMEESEQLAGDRSQLDAERARLDGEAASLRAAIVESEAAIDAELQEHEQVRAADAATVPADLLATYDGLRKRLGGVGVARLDGNRCLGCHLTLPATEVDQLRRQPADAVLRHEECGRILVRPS